MMNKKAQIGRALLTMPTLITLIIVTALFISISLFISLKAESPEDANFFTPNEKNFILQKIEINEKKMLLLDAYILFGKEQLTEEELKSELEKLLTEKKDCLILAKGTTENFLGREKGGAVNDDFAMELKDSTPFSHQRGFKPTFFSNYAKEKNPTTLQINDGQNIEYIAYYHGGCLE